MEVNKLFFMLPAFRAKLILRDVSKPLKTEITAISWQNARVCEIRTIRDVTCTPNLSVLLNYIISEKDYWSLLMNTISTLSGEN